MLEIIKEIDTLLFLIINRTLVNPVFDLVMPFITQFKNSILLLVFLALYILYKKRIKGLEIIIATTLAVILADQLSSHLFKPFFARERPCAFLENVRLLMWCNSSYSFTSSHAATTMAGGTVVYLYLKSLRTFFLAAIVVIAIGFSRVYIGIHYPFDVFGGWILGITSGFLCYGVFKKIPFLKK